MATPNPKQDINQVKDSAKAEKPLIDATLATDKSQTLNITTLPKKTDIEKKQTSSITEAIVEKTDADFRPKEELKPQLAIKYEICTPLLRFPLTLKKLRKVNTYIPIMINYFEVVHYMDSLIADNIYFQKLGLPWHPFLSRLYFSIVFYIQALRAMRHARIGSTTTRLFVEQFLKDYPPESVPIPGPIIPMLQTICTCSSDNPLFNLISPFIRNEIGIENASDLLDLESLDFLLPNVPLIVGFINTIIHAEGPIPDYTIPETFDTEEDHLINGHHFEADNWTPLERAALLSPGMNCAIESTPEIDETFHQRGRDLDIPVLEGNESIQGIEKFLLMENDSSWFLNIIEVMTVYCSFFKESSNLGACSPNGPTGSLIRSRLHHLSSPTANENIVNHLQTAFPGKYPFTLTYEHRSFELNIPQAYQLMGQFCAANTSSRYRGLPIWGDFNNLNTGREGPYWNQNPSTLSSKEENSIIEIEDIISTEYFIENPL